MRRHRQSERQTMAKRNIIPIFIPFSGCPVKCIYCNQNQITGVKGLLSAKEVEERITTALERNGSRPSEVAFYGGTFTMLAQEKQKALLSAVQTFIERGQVTGIRLSTRPEGLDNEAFERLKAYGVKTIEFGIQSTDPEVLQSSMRGVDVREMDLVVKSARASGIQVGLQQMIGLPKDSFEKDLNTARWIMERGDFVRIYPTVVFRGTELYAMYRQGRYEPLTLKEAIDRTAVLLDEYEAAGLRVIRVGLPQMDRSAYVAGPYHDNFREFAESLRRLNKIFIRYKSVRSVEGSGRSINYLVGPYGYGRKALEKTYGPIIFRTIPDEGNLLRIDGEEKDTYALN